MYQAFIDGHILRCTVYVRSIIGQMDLYCKITLDLIENKNIATYSTNKDVNPMERTA